MTTQVDLDGFLRTRSVAALLDISTRWLKEHVRHGRFPPPDCPAGKLGESDLWRRSTVKRGLEELASKGRRSAA